MESTIEELREITKTAKKEKISKLIKQVKLCMLSAAREGYDYILFCPRIDKISKDELLLNLKIVFKDYKIEKIRDVDFGFKISWKVE